MNFPSRVLIVDDEAHIRKYVGLLVKSLGASVVIEAANGLDAITTYEREPADLVLLDVNMPQIDGLETLKRLKQVDPDCVVVMLTSLANRHTVEQASELGAANYLRKDTPRDEITAALKETIAACFDSENPTP